MKAQRLSVFLATIVTTVGGFANADLSDEVDALNEAGSFIEALTRGDAELNFRFRAESVDQEGLDDATASTLRTTLAYRTQPFSGFSAFVEVEDIRAIGNDERYSDGGANGVTGRAVIVDPEGTEINQAYLRYVNGATSVTAGRQDLTHRKAPFHRFVGNVLWRQNRQTYDGVRIQNTSVEDLNLEASYIYNVNRIFGEDNPLPNRSDYDLDGRLWRATYSGLDVDVEGYFYDLDFSKAPSLSTTTVGLRLSGSRPLRFATRGDAASEFVYSAEFARQSDTANNPGSYNVNYYLVEVGAKVGGWLVKLSHERLEGTGQPGESFKTPLATLHAYQGWADKFLATPDGGIEDTFLTLKGKIRGFATLLVVHRFDSDSGGFSYGREVDLQITRKFGRYNVGLKYATYGADGDVRNVGGPGLDTDKLWAWVQFAFK